MHLCSQRLWSRRAILTAGVGLVAGCRAANGPPPLRLHILKNSVPSVWVRRFHRRYALDVATQPQQTDLQAQLAKPDPPDVLTLGLAWLPQVQAERKLSPWQPKNLTRWRELPPQWQKVGSTQNQLWWVPYRWGTTALAYRRDQLTWQPEDWASLWRPELRQRVSAIAQFRELLALCFLRLGRSINTPAPWPLLELKAQLQALHQQIRLYSDSHYLQPLVLGDVVMAVGWSSDLLALAQRYPEIQVVMPPGSTIWADGWVLPAGKSMSRVATAWVNFCWEPEQLASLETQGLAWSPFAPQLQQYEFYRPLNPATQAAYAALRRWWLALSPVTP